MPHRISDGSHRRWSFWTLGMPLLLLGLTLGLGTWGFWEFFHRLAEAAPEEAVPPRLRDAFFHAVGLAWLETIDLEEFDAIPPQLDLARAFGVATFAYAATLALLALFGDVLKGPRIRSWRLRPESRQDGHAVVCGLGWRGEELVHDLLARGWRVAVIEKDAENPFRSGASARGAIVLQGDSLDLKTLDRADVCFAGKIFIPGDSDETNLRILKQIGSLRTGRSRKRKSSQCNVHVQDARTREFIHPSMARDSGLYVNCFDTSVATARFLMEEHPFDGAPGTESTEVHVLVFGYGSMARALLLQAMLLGQFLGEKRLRVTVLAEEAQRCQQQFLRDYPCFLPGSVGEDPTTHRLQREVLPTVDFLELPTSDTELLDPAGGFLSRIGPGSVTTLYVCLDDGMRSSAYASALLPALGRRAEAVGATVQLFYYYNYPNDGHGSLVESGLSELAPGVRVHAFANFVHGCTVDAVEGRPADDVARQIALFFRRTWGGEEWERLSEADRLSNRRAADHIAVKLRCIGARVVNGSQPGPDFSFTNEEVDLLAELEHRRWCAERLLSGWRSLPRTRENLKLWQQQKQELKRTKVHLDLVPFHELGDQDKHKDYDQIRHIPHFLRAVGRRAERVSLQTAEPQPVSISSPAPGGVE
jgi:hypothetical protein